MVLNQPCADVGVLPQTVVVTCGSIVKENCDCEGSEKLLMRVPPSANQHCKDTKHCVCLKSERFSDFSSPTPEMSSRFSDSTQSVYQHMNTNNQKWSNHSLTLFCFPSLSLLLSFLPLNRFFLPLLPNARSLFLSLFFRHMYSRLHFAIKAKIKLYFKLPFSQKKIGYWDAG